MFCFLRPFSTSFTMPLKRVPFQERTNVVNMNAGITAHSVYKNITKNHNTRILPKELVVILYRMDIDKHLQKNINSKTGQNRKTPFFRLRRGVPKTYFEESEVSLKESEMQENVFAQHKVPIYKQTDNITKETRKQDPYELDISDSDKEQKTIKKKKRKRDPSDVFNKTIFQVLQELERKEKTANKKIIPQKKIARKVKGPNKYEKNVQDALQRIMEKKHIMKNPKKSQLKKGEISKSNLVPQKQAVLIPPSRPSETSEVIKNVVDVFDTVKSPIPNATSNVLKNTDDVFDMIKSSNIVNTEIATTSRYLTAPEFQNHASPSSIQNDNDYPNSSDDECFGFKDGENEPESRVNIINNILLDKSIDVSTLIDNKIPNANSTMISTNKTPWRIPIRNPSNYLLHYKKDAMPCIKQDAIVDHKLADGIEEHCSKNKTLQTSLKPSVQTSILNYIDSSVHSYASNQENMQRISLYDYEEFMITHKRDPIKRKVLGELNEPNQTESTPIKYIQKEFHSPDMSVIRKSGSPRNSSKGSTPINKPSQEIAFMEADTNKTYFGFESVESVKTEVLLNRSSAAKPFRINTGVNRYNKQLKCKIVDEVSTLQEDLPSILNSQQNLDNEIHDKSQEVQLFGDAEPELLVTTDDIPFTYSRPRTRRKRLNSNASNDGDKSKKKKKDMMTVAEKEEFEKWASKFNAMCEEIDKHELEIE